MKKIFTIIIVGLLSICAVSAQKLISIGPRAAINATFDSPNSITPTYGEAGWKFGASIEIRPIKLLGISVDFMYSTMNFNQSYNNGTIKYDLGYLETPILLNVYLWKGLAVKGGIQPGVKLRGSVGLEGSSTNNIADDIYNNIKSGKFDIPVGVGYTFGFGLTADVRYNLGMTKISSNTQFNANTFELGLGWKF